MVTVTGVVNRNEHTKNAGLTPMQTGNPAENATRAKVSTREQVSSIIIGTVDEQRVTTGEEVIPMLTVMVIIKVSISGGLATGELRMVVISVVKTITVNTSKLL